MQYPSKIASPNPLLCSPLKRPSSASSSDKVVTGSLLPPARGQGSELFRVQRVTWTCTSHKPWRSWVSLFSPSRSRRHPMDSWNPSSCICPADWVGDAMLIGANAFRQHEIDEVSEGGTLWEAGAERLDVFLCNLIENLGKDSTHNDSSNYIKLYYSYTI